MTQPLSELYTQRTTEDVQVVEQFRVRRNLNLTVVFFSTFW
jgi:hypothetical protein